MTHRPEWRRARTKAGAAAHAFIGDRVLCPFAGTGSVPVTYQPAPLSEHGVPFGYVCSVCLPRWRRATDAWLAAVVKRAFVPLLAALLLAACDAGNSIADCGGACRDQRSYMIEWRGEGQGGRCVCSEPEPTRQDGGSQ